MSKNNHETFATANFQGGSLKLQNHFVLIKYMVIWGKNWVKNRLKNTVFGPFFLMIYK